MIKCLNNKSGDNWTLYHGDCVAVSEQMPDECIDLSIYSPPFASLYTYSDSVADMGNCKDDDEFFDASYRIWSRLFLTSEIKRNIGWLEHSFKSADSGDDFIDRIVSVGLSASLSVWALAFPFDFSTLNKAIFSYFFNCPFNL